MQLRKYVCKYYIFLNTHTVLDKKCQDIFLQAKNCVQQFLHPCRLYLHPVAKGNFKPQILCIKITKLNTHNLKFLLLVQLESFVCTRYLYASCLNNGRVSNFKAYNILCILYACRIKLLSLQ